MKNDLKRIWTIAELSLLELYRRRDVYAGLILGAVILAPLVSLQLFGVQGIVRYLREAVLLLVWIFSLIVTLATAARQLPAELEARTIYPLLSRPVSRGQVLTGKALGAFLATGSCLLLFYCCYGLLTGLREGYWPNWVFAQALLLHLGFVLLLTALVILGSVLLTPSANLTCNALAAVGMLLFGQRLAEIAGTAAAPASWAAGLIHAVAPHFEFFDLRQRLIHGWEPLSWALVAAVMVYALLYAAALLGLATLIFRRKKL